MSDTFLLFDRTGERKRTVSIDEEGRVTMRLFNVVCLTDSGTSEEVTGLDPDGGPFIGVGSRFDDWIITHIYHVDQEDPHGDEERTVLVIGRAVRNPLSH